MVRPCSTIVDGNCPGIDGNPVSNYSSESPDGLDYIQTFWQGSNPPLGQYWTATNCGQTFVSQVSQADAQLQATSAAQQCNFNQTNPNPSGGSSGVLFNTPQTASATCPGGAVFNYTVQAGLFIGVNQAQADAFAYSAAVSGAQQNKICLSDLQIQNPCSIDDSALSTGQESTITITANGNSLAVFPHSNYWEIVDGNLPPGMNFNGGFLLTTENPTITGTPLTTGTYTFTVKITANWPSGFYMQRQYTLQVKTCPPLSLNITDYVAFLNSWVVNGCLANGASYLNSTYPNGLPISLISADSTIFLYETGNVVVRTCTLPEGTVFFSLNFNTVTSAISGLGYMIYDIIPTSSVTFNFIKNDGNNSDVRGTYVIINVVNNGQPAPPRTTFSIS